MRSLRDRIRHTVIFEAIALVIVAFGGGLITGEPPEIMGALSLMFSVLVMIWNLAYNWMFDHWDRKYRNGAKRGVRLRLVHAVLFEAGLLFAGVFLISWWLEVTLLQALLIDIGFAAFFVAYAFAYNWVYDIVFPVPAQQSANPNPSEMG